MPGYLPNETGYCILDDGTLYVSSLSKFPGCTPEMFQWWMWWHSAESERYALWHPHCHCSVRATDQKVLNDNSLSHEEKLIGNKHIITEYLEGKKNDITIEFIDPKSAGIDTSKFAEAGIKAHACGWVNLQKPNARFALMVHLARGTDEGFELRSRYYIGYKIQLNFLGWKIKIPEKLKKIVLRIEKVNLKTAYFQAVHDQLEFTRLARILKGLYTDFCENKS